MGGSVGHRRTSLCPSPPHFVPMCPLCPLPQGLLLSGDDPPGLNPHLRQEQPLGEGGGGRGKIRGGDSKIRGEGSQKLVLGGEEWG